MLETALGTRLLRTHPVYRLAVRNKLLPAQIIDEAHTLQLYTADLTTIIAHWQQGTPMSLILAPEVVTSQAQILAAFMYEEQRLRVRERNGQVQAEAALWRARYPELKTVLV
jgi:hypothetical protein